MTALRDLEGVKGNGKLDAFRVDWRVIRPDPDNDLRDLTTADNRAHIEQIKDSIEAEGVKDPLTIRTDDHDAILATDGRVRLVALAELEAESRAVPQTVLVLPEPRGTSREDRTVNMILLSSLRKNYDPFEVARGLKRLAAFGMSEEKICERMRWKSVATLHHYLDSLGMKPVLRTMVADGKISRTEALKLQKRTDADPGEILQAAEEEHKRLNKKGPVRVRPRDVKRVTRAKTEKQEPAQHEAAKSDPTNGADHSALSASAAQIEAVAPEIEERVSVSETDGGQFVGIDGGGADGRLDVSEITEVRSFDAVAEADRLLAIHKSPTHLVVNTPGALHRAIQALAIFAKHAEESCVNERPDEYVVEIPASDLKRAWEAYQAVAGDVS